MNGNKRNGSFFNNINNNSNKYKVNNYNNFLFYELRITNKYDITW